MRCVLDPLRKASRCAALRMALCAVSILLAGFAADAAEQFVRSGASGDAIVLHDHAGWDRTCAALAPPSVHLDAPPLHGVVCLRADDIRVEYVSYGTQTQCIGRLVRGVRLIYRPHAGYTGADGLRYSVQYPKARREVAVNISVLPPAPATSGAAPTSFGAPAPQAPGTIPPCNDFVS